MSRPRLPPLLPSPPSCDDRFGVEPECTLLEKDINWPLGWRTGSLLLYYWGLISSIDISGIKGEVMPGQFQAGPSVGISAGDKVRFAGYILETIIEISGADLKPIPRDWNGAGAHTHCSTESTRKDSGFVIVAAIEKIKLRHKEHIAACGKGNESRTGVPNRGASIHVGRKTEQNGKGYFEDRRPASNAETSMIAETTIL